MHSPEQASVPRFIVIACVLLVFALLAPGYAATIAVNTSADELDFIPNSKCSLREAIVTVNEQRAEGVGGCLVVGQLGNADEIIVPAGIFRLTRISAGFTDIDQDADNLDLLADVILRGAGAGKTVIDGDDIYLNVGVGITGPLLEGGVLRVGAGVNAVVSGVTLRNGHADFGGAVYVAGELALLNAAVESNRAGRSGGGIDNDGDLTMRNVTVSGNEARAASLPGGTAGAIYNSGSLDALNVTISGNFGYFVGGVLVGQGSSLVILSSVTITDNESPGGSHFADVPTGGLMNDVAAEVVRLENTLIAGNSGPSGEGPDCRGAFDSRGFNLIGDVTDCSGFSAGSNKTGTAAAPLDPVLSALANHGGTTRTHALLAGSIAIDGGPLGILDSCPDTDQRGSSRANDGDGNGFSHCDIGAYEAPTGTASQANLEISLSAAPDPVGAGGTIEYAVTVTNNGPSNATGVSYRLYLPAGSGAVTRLPSGCAASGASVNCTIGNLDDLEQLSHLVRVTAPATTGTATASVTVSSSSDPEPADDTAEAAIRVVNANSADLAVAINGPTGVEVGDDIAYSVTVGNLGPLPSGSNTRVTSFLPSGTSFVAASSGCAYTDRVQCTVGSLALRGTKTLSITIKAPSQPTNLTISALVSDKGGVDSDADNNSASLSVNVLPPPPPSADLAIQLLGPSTAQVGTAVTYTLIVNNNGPDTAENAWATLPIPTGVGIISLPDLCGANGVVACQFGAMLNGESWTLPLVLRTPNTEGTLQFTAATADNGDSVDPFEVNDTATATTTITAAPPPPGADLSLSKSAPVQVQSGATFDYTLVVTNNGPDAATAVTISDGLPSEVSVVSIPDGCNAILQKLRCEVATLAAGASSSFTVAVTAPDLAPDASSSSDITVINTASVGANEDDPDVDDNEDSATTVVTAPKPAGAPSLEIKPHPDAKPSLTVAPDETGVVALRFQASAGAAEAVAVEAVTVRAEGTAGSTGIANVALYRDADEDGEPDQGGFLTSGAFAGNGDAVTLTLPSVGAFTLPAAGTSGYLLVVDFSTVDALGRGAPPAGLVALLLAPFLWHARSRRRFRTVLLALIIGGAGLTSCVTDPQPPAKLTHQLVIESVAATGELAGDTAVITGVPLKGTVISR